MSYYSVICEDFFKAGVARKRECCFSCHNEMADGEYWGGHAVSPPEKNKYGYVDAPEVIACCAVVHDQIDLSRNDWVKVLRVMRGREAVERRTPI